MRSSRVYLGGFHLALRQLGHRCVFASEIDVYLRELYEKNFDIKPEGDIRGVDVNNIPDHDILCAGFPCQPFSKAGRQDGLSDPELGELYKYILKVIKRRHPQYLILENVPNLEMHNDKQTWRHIKSLLEAEGYTVLINKLSPDEFGIPQIRERIYIVGRRGNLDAFKWPETSKTEKEGKTEKEVTVEDYLDHCPKEARKLPDYVNRCLVVWQEFLDNLPPNEKIPHPIWSTEFGATYPYKKTTPSRMSYENLRKYRGTHGQLLSKASTKEEIGSLLPSHALRDQDVFPDWKIRYIQKNRVFYEQHRNWLDDWIPKIHQFASSLQKLEWNCQTEKSRRIKDCVLQIRPSGVRVKKKTTIPSLVAMTATQIPIITWEKRYITPS
ncbi:DNA (cytosine-5-)-methyltransferase [Candidatus Bathyarchaeota archaeon]|nr:DNA (cytosine-5-)-methyltransferase [Candidatus Bathyarchaeota archaeon]